MSNTLIDGSNNYAGGSNSIIIGEGLSSDKDYHLLVDIEDIKIDQIMSEKEHAMILGVIKSGLVLNSGHDKLSRLHKESLKEWNGEGVISFCHEPDSVGRTTIGNENETNYNSTEFWCAMKILDDLKVPKKEEGTNKPYSIVGRILWLERNKNNE